MEHMLGLYGKPFLLGFILSSIFCVSIIYLHKKFNISNIRDGERHLHKKNISRFGGAAIIMAVIISIFLDQNLLFDKIVWALIICGMLILCIGLIDDIKQVSWKTQFFVQIVIVLFTFIIGIRIEFITNPMGEGVLWLVNDDVSIVSLLFMFIWMLVIMNAVNWSDGIDGLSGGIVFIVAIVLFITSLKPHINQPPIAILAIILAGSVLGFLIFNLPLAKIFAGTSGSFFMGYAVALLAIAAGAKIGTTLLVLAVPIMDAVWVIMQRFHSGKSIFRSDTRHLHHKLYNRGWSINRILLGYYLITVFCAVIAISMNAQGKIIALTCIFIVTFIFFIYLTNDKQIQI